MFLFILIFFYLAHSVYYIENASSNRMNMPEPMLRIRNHTLRSIVFREKKNNLKGKLQNALKDAKQFTNVCYNKMIVSTADGINAYNDLSDDEQTLLEVIISFCF